MGGAARGQGHQLSGRFRSVVDLAEVPNLAVAVSDGKSHGILALEVSKPTNASLYPLMVRSLCFEARLGQHQQPSFALAWMERATSPQGGHGVLLSINRI
jgi:hypothetical protein